MKFFSEFKIDGPKRPVPARNTWKVQAYNLSLKPATDLAFSSQVRNREAVARHLLIVSGNPESHVED